MAPFAVWLFAACGKAPSGTCEEANDCAGGDDGGLDAYAFDGSLPDGQTRDGSSAGDGGEASPGCTTELCPSTACADGGTTTLTGVAYDPAGNAPVVGAVVYVPTTRTMLAPFSPGIPSDCTWCSDPSKLPGGVVASAVTGADGSFSLSNVPAGASIPLVIELGKWRRQLVVSQVNACGSNAVDASLTRLPGKQSDGDMPRIALGTACDMFECLLRDFGWDDTEFSAPGGTGSVQLYPEAVYGAWPGPGVPLDAGADGGDAGIGPPPGLQTPDALMADAGLLATYDAVILGCDCAGTARSATELSDLAGYVGAGGRFLTSHFGYEWLYQNAPLSPMATWNVLAGTNPEVTATLVDGGLPVQEFDRWLTNLDASVDGSMVIQSPRVDLGAETPATSTVWMTQPFVSDGGLSVPLQVSTDVPIGSAGACGRVHFLDYHASLAPAAKLQFPAECALPGDSFSPPSPNARAIEFTLFDLLSCR